MESQLVFRASDGDMLVNVYQFLGLCRGRGNLTKATVFVAFHDVIVTASDEPSIMSLTLSLGNTHPIGHHYTIVLPK